MSGEIPPSTYKHTYPSTEKIKSSFFHECVGYIAYAVNKTTVTSASLLPHSDKACARTECRSRQRKLSLHRTESKQHGEGAKVTRQVKERHLAPLIVSRQLRTSLPWRSLRSKMTWASNSFRRLFSLFNFIWEWKWFDFKSTTARRN